MMLSTILLPLITLPSTASIAVSPLNNTLTQPSLPQFTPSTNSTTVEKRRNLNIKECLDRNSDWKGSMTGKDVPWQIVCCAHAPGKVSRMHCMDYGNPHMDLFFEHEMGSCERAPGRYNHGPFCGKAIHWGVHIWGRQGPKGKGESTYKPIERLSEAEDNYGRYSPEGKEMLRHYIDAFRKRMRCRYSPKGKPLCLGPFGDWENYGIPKRTQWP
jgi:hypothetical protein